MSGLDLRPNRNYPNITGVTDDTKSHRDALRGVIEALDIAQRRTSDINSSFIRVSDLVDLGIISLQNGSFATTPATYTPSAHTHTLATGITDEGTLAYLSSVGTSEIASLAVTNAKLDNMAQATIKGRASASGTGSPIDLSAAQVAAIVEASISHSALLNLTTGDPHTQYVKKAGDTMTGTLNTRQLTPTSTDTYDLGTTSLLYRQLLSTTARIGSRASGTLSLTNNSSWLGGYMEQLNGGTASITADPGYAQSYATVIGRAYADGATATATITATADPCFVSADIYSVGGEASALATNFSTTIIGGAYSSLANASCRARIRSQGVGSAVIGYVESYAAFTSRFEASGTGALTAGHCISNAGASSAAAATMLASGAGAMVQGRSRNGTIQATSEGAFARGLAEGGTITASNLGSFASGYAFTGYNITASGQGSVAVGLASGGNVVCSADNAMQLGIGTNAHTASLKIGNAGLRFSGVGLPGTPGNGDIVVNGAFVQTYSNGKYVQQNTGAAGWTTGTYATRRSFSGLTPTTTEVLELLETLIEELKTANIIN